MESWSCRASSSSVVPTMLVFGLDMTQGPTLIFSTLPELFNVMPAGRLLGSVFLLSLIVNHVLKTEHWEDGHFSLMPLKES